MNYLQNHTTTFFHWMLGHNFILALFAATLLRGSGADGTQGICDAKNDACDTESSLNP